jgi:hypothetical protein
VIIPVTISWQRIEPGWADKPMGEPVELRAEVEFDQFGDVAEVVHADKAVWQDAGLFDTFREEDRRGAEEQAAAAAAKIFDAKHAAACENCGERGPTVRDVTYDAMVDGPGSLASELVCEPCSKGAA